MQTQNIRNLSHNFKGCEALPQADDKNCIFHADNNNPPAHSMIHISAAITFCSINARLNVKRDFINNFYVFFCLAKYFLFDFGIES
jgi:hypothetical protein